MSFKDRLKQARNEAKPKKVTQKQLADLLGITPQAVSQWESGEAEPEIEKLAAIAKKVGRSVDWLLGVPPIPAASADEDDDDRPATRELLVLGYVGAGGQAHFYAFSDGGHDKIAASDRDPPNAAAVEIRGTSLGRLFDRWYAIYNDVRRPITDDLIGKLCVVGLSDGQVLIKKIERRGKRFALISNSDTEPPVENVKIEWAAPVTDIRART